MRCDFARADLVLRQTGFRHHDGAHSTIVTSQVKTKLRPRQDEYYKG